MATAAKKVTGTAPEAVPQPADEQPKPVKVTGPAVRAGGHVLTDNGWAPERKA